jgi:hypothetical protein
MAPISYLPMHSSSEIQLAEGRPINISRKLNKSAII